MRHATALSLLLFLSAIPVPAGDASWSKSDGDFKATLAFERAAEVVATEGLTPDETVRGKPIFASIVFEGCARNEKESCDVLATFTATTPEGKPLGDPIFADQGKTEMPGQAKIRMLTGKLGVVLQPIGALGTYKVKVELLDRVAKKQLVLEREFKAVEAPTKPQAM